MFRAWGLKFIGSYGLGSRAYPYIYIYIYFTNLAGPWHWEMLGGCTGCVATLNPGDFVSMCVVHRCDGKPKAALTVQSTMGY